MPDFNDLSAITDITRPDTADRSHEERAALRAVLWRVDSGQLSREDGRVVLEALGLVDTQPDTLCPPLSREERATAARRASMARLRAAQAAKKDEDEGAA